MSDLGRSETYTFIELLIALLLSKLVAVGNFPHDKDDVDFDDKRNRENKRVKTAEINRNKVEIEHVKALLLVLYLRAIFLITCS